MTHLAIEEIHIIVPIPKNSDLSSPSNYRPVSYVNYQQDFGATHTFSHSGTPSFSLPVGISREPFNSECPTLLYQGLIN